MLSATEIANTPLWRCSAGSGRLATVVRVNPHTLEVHYRVTDCAALLAKHLCFFQARFEPVTGAEHNEPLLGELVA